MADTEGEEKKPDTGALNLKVVTQDGNEIFFKCKMTTPLQKVCVDVRCALLRLLVEGHMLRGPSTMADACPYLSGLAPTPPRVRKAAQCFGSTSPLAAASDRLLLTASLDDSRALAPAADDGLLQPAGRGDELGALPL